MTVKMIYLLILLITLIIGGAVFAYSYRRRKTPGAIYFMYLLLAIFLYNGAYCLEISANNLRLALFWYDVEHIAIIVLPYLWMLVCLDFTSASQNLKSRLRYIVILYLVFCYVSFYTNHFHHLFDMSYQFESNGYFRVIIASKGILYYIMAIINSIIMIFTIILYIKSCFEVPRIYRNSHIITILASLFPWIAGIFNQTPANTLELDYYPISLIASAFIFCYGIFRFRIMRTVPIVHKMIFNRVNDGILLMDLNDYIIDSNHTFDKLFPNYQLNTMKSTLDSFLKEYQEIGENLNDPSESSFCLTLEEEVHIFRAEMLDITVENNKLIGKILLFNDITPFVENQKKLEAAVTEAVNRAETNEIAFLQAQINPHFLNNTLSLISSMITREPQKAKETIADISEYLMKCYQFNANDPMQSFKDELDFVKTYTAIEKARFMERLQVNILCEGIPSIRVPRLIIQPLVENAIRHGVLKKAMGGTVEVLINETKEGVFVEIKDDGVGIPIELIPTLLDPFTESQGVGIRNIHKRLIKYYGNGLHIDRLPEQGTCVSFLIPTGI